MKPARSISASSGAPLALQRPGEQAVVVLALAATALVWTLCCAFFYVTPPWDDVEELFWAGSFEFGYYKHPPLPAWIMGVLVRLAGREPWLTYAAGLACGLGALFIVWKWSRQLMGARRAALALLLGSLVTYHVPSATVFNHNTVQLLPLAGFWWMLWRALRAPTSRTSDWAWLGVFAALAFLTKYSAAVQFALGLAFIAREGLWRSRPVRRGIALAGVVALMLLAPHIAWMVLHPELSIAYALHSVRSTAPDVYTWRSLLHVVTLQVARLAPMLLAAALLWRLRAVHVVPGASAMTPSPGAFDRRFLAWATFGPLCLVIPLAALLRIGLLPSWLTTFYLSAAMWLVLNVRGLEAETWSRLKWRIVIVATACVHLAAALGQGLVQGTLGRTFGLMTRTNLPAESVALALGDIWQRRVGTAPLRLLVGDTWFAGAVVLKMDPSVQLLVDGEERDSPWLAPGALAREGGMIVILDNADFRSEGPLLEPLLASARCRGSLDIPWTGKGERQSARVRWGVVPPRDFPARDCSTATARPSD